ncbi:fasciclin domain-containing protein [Candidatus Uabimicrobium amorphum]|uniref:FAS1 domain-containing protein n=1 Tax=Uabimicrobium amorphum TaxID=2596890 RepID=A0A5S9IUB6_UABAM|nr:fasciclin domain-containing protein [Candidatus Uabimicrobium amorphum]BBM88074.1 hypothetical protein UABAM_06490 [Candidatus Uabimicrobium amorphum]
MRYILLGLIVLVAPFCQKDIVDTAVASGKFNTLVAAVKAAGLVDTLKSDGPFTVFAPTDEAFAKLPKGTVEALLNDPQGLAAILKYHVVAGKVLSNAVVTKNGQGVTTVNGADVVVTVTKNDNKAGVKIDGANVVVADIECSNGVIHVIDAVILPPSKDVVTTAIGNDQFKTLVAAVKAAGLVETLQGDGPFTVFAPTDGAFGKLPQGTVEALVGDKPKLTGILTYHVVAGKVYSGNLQSGKVKTVNGKELDIVVKDGAVTINGAKVVVANVKCSNGVIHVIDTVVLP